MRNSVTVYNLGDLMKAVEDGEPLIYAHAEAKAILCHFFFPDYINSHYAGAVKILISHYYYDLNP